MSLPVGLQPTTNTSTGQKLALDNNMRPTEANCCWQKNYCFGFDKTQVDNLGSQEL